MVSAGERDPDAEGVTGMSASKMRAAAVEGDSKSFMMGLPKGFRDGNKLFQDVRKYMGIREDKDMGSMTDFESVRDAYLTGKVWNVGDLIEANGVTGIIIRKGTNYVSYNDGDGKVHKAWLHDITLDERNYAKEYANYQGMPVVPLESLPTEHRQSMEKTFHINILSGTESILLIEKKF